MLEGGQISEGTIWEFEVARFLAPVVTGYTAVQGIALLFSEQLAKLWARFARGHVVICGLGEKGSRLARGFRAEGRRVVAMDSDPGNPYLPLCRERGVTVLLGDAAGEEALRGANITAASYLFAVCGNDGVNAQVAASARALTAGRRSGRATHTSWTYSCRLLRERYCGPRTDAFRLEFFNIYESGSYASPPTPLREDRRAHLRSSAWGTSARGSAGGPAGGGGHGAALPVTVVDREADAGRPLQARFPYLGGRTVREIDGPPRSSPVSSARRGGDCPITSAHLPALRR